VKSALNAFGFQGPCIECKVLSQQGAHQVLGIFWSPDKHACPGLRVVAVRLEPTFTTDKLVSIVHEVALPVLCLEIQVVQWRDRSHFPLLPQI